MARLSDARGADDLRQGTWEFALADAEGSLLPRAGQPATDYLVDPYPGERPSGSFVIDRAGLCWPVKADADTPCGWVVETVHGRVCLDEWLTGQGAASLGERVPLLGYGSNASPGKVLANGTPLPSVHLACAVEGLAAVWCAGQTAAGRIPVTLTEAPGHAEEAVIMMCDPVELAVLDRVEGRLGRWYDLVTLSHGRVVLSDGAQVLRPIVYVGGRSERFPMLLGGNAVRRSDVDQAGARLLFSLPHEVEVPPALGEVVPPGTYPPPGGLFP